MTRRFLVLAAIAGALVLPGRALADPTNAPTSMTSIVTCTNGQTYTLVINAGNSPGNPNTGAPWVVAHIIGNGSGVMTTVSLTMGGGPTYTKNGGGVNDPNAQVVTCTGTVDLGGQQVPVTTVQVIR
ncbi:MAG TPA: hypothetical protein VFB58_13850 [Chloroflexota bacterium]|nr:hypothetical protein [Chloroflexota bacterium]